MATPKNFRAWFAANLSEHAEDLANHGADAGYPDITYTSDCVAVFDQFADEIWTMAVDDADDMGEKNVCAMIAGFTRSDMLGDWNTFKTLMLWYACEKVAREVVDAKENPTT